MTDTQIKTMSGPMINHKPTTIALLTQPQLAESRLLALLPPLMNPAFRISHTTSGVLPAEVDRLQSKMQILQELGSDASTYILYSSSTSTAPNTVSALLATASFQPFTGGFPADMSNNAKSFKNAPAPLPEGCIAWELKLMAVDPQIQKRGVASTLLSIIEADVQKRASAISAAKAANGESLIKETQLKLSTIREINEEFFLKKGFKVVGEKKHPPGTYGSKTGFTTSDLTKVLP